MYKTKTNLSRILGMYKNNFFMPGVGRKSHSRPRLNTRMYSYR